MTNGRSLRNGRRARRALLALGLLAAAGRAAPVLAQAPGRPRQPAGRLTIDIYPGPRIAVGQLMTLRLTSSVAGNLLVLNEDESGFVWRIFPQPGTEPLRAGLGQARTRIRAGQTMAIPGPADDFEFRVAPPAGQNRVLAMVVPASTPLDPAAERQLMEAVSEPDALVAEMGRRIDRPLTVPRTALAVAERRYEIVAP